MSYPIRSGIWFQDEDDFNKVAADLKDLLDYTEKDRFFVHWETYGNGETVEIFEAIAKKYGFDNEFSSINVWAAHPD